MTRSSERVPFDDVVSHPKYEEVWIRHRDKILDFTSDWIGRHKPFVMGNDFKKAVGKLREAMTSELAVVMLDLGWTEAEYEEASRAYDLAASIEDED